MKWKGTKMIFDNQELSRRTFSKIDDTPGHKRLEKPQLAAYVDAFS
jgi:hypothetical protein